MPMNSRDQDDHGTGHGDAFDDATVEELLGGRYQGGSPDLVAVGQLLEQVRSLAEQPVPPPSPALAQMLTDAGFVSGAELLTAGRWRLRPHRPVILRRRTEGPQRVRYPARPAVLASVAAAVCAVLVSGVLAAGSARLLPGPIQNAVASIVNAVTPFDFPSQRKPKARHLKPASPETASTETGRPSEDPNGPARGDTSQPGKGAPGANGNPPFGSVGTDSRSPRSRGVNAAPTPASTAAPGAAPNVPKTNGHASDGVSSLVPPPLPERFGFRAGLNGAKGAPTVGNLVGYGTAVLNADLGSHELCLTLSVSGIDPVTSADLRAGSMGLTGPVVAAFTEPTDGPATECVTVTDKLINDIRNETGNYYIDVNTIAFPDGALRGQLTK